MTIRVGVVTYHAIPNYGAMLQAVALQKFLEKHGYEPELIDYRPWPVVKTHIRHRYMGLAKGPVGWSRARRHRLFMKYLQRETRLTSKRYFRGASLRGIENKFDILVCGSDEIWNFTNAFGWDPAFLLDFGGRNVAARVSYAGSSGSLRLSSDRTNWMRSRLERFKRILVRDVSTAHLIKDSLGLACAQVLDPSFLVDLEDLGLKRYAGGEEPYVMITGQLNQNDLRMAIEIAKNLGLKTIGVGYQYEGVDENRYELDPGEWLRYLSGAKLVISSLFHATCFSLKNDVPFYTFVPKGKEQKLHSLLDRFELDGRLIDGSSKMEELLSYQYSATELKALEKRKEFIRESSKLFLDAIESHGI